MKVVIKDGDLVGELSVSEKKVLTRAADILDIAGKVNEDVVRVAELVRQVATHPGHIKSVPTPDPE